MNEKEMTFKQKALKKVRAAYSAVERKIVPVACSASVALGTVMITASAEGETTLALTAINSGDVLSNMMPFVNAAVPVMAVVGGVKLGRSFLKSAFH